jgi:hypothetical protein
MKTVKMVSLKQHSYDSRSLKRDEIFQAEEKDVHILTVLGRARLANPEEKSEGKYQRRDLRSND